MSDNKQQGFGNGEQSAAFDQNTHSTQQPPYGGYYGYPPHFAHPHQAQQQRVEQANLPPQMGHMPPPMWHHPMWMHHPAFCHPSMMPPPNWHSHPHMHPAMHHPMYQGMQPPMPGQDPAQEEANDALFEQAQAMLEGAMGEEAGMFKDILGSLGMNDKEFWKGAMVGAAAALLLSNENVRGKLMGLVSGAGDMLKTGGSAVKESATNTAHSVKENVNAGGEIFRDTYTAGKQGFQESVERHKEAKQEEVAPVVEAVAQTDSEADSDVKPV